MAPFSKDWEVHEAVTYLTMYGYNFFDSPIPMIGGDYRAQELAWSGISHSRRSTIRPRNSPSPFPSSRYAIQAKSALNRARIIGTSAGLPSPGRLILIVETSISDSRRASNCRYSGLAHRIPYSRK